MDKTRRVGTLLGLLGFVLALAGCEPFISRPQYPPPPPPPAPTATPPPSRPLFYVNASRLNLRACPGMDCPKVAALERNEEVEKVAEAEDWVQVRIKRDGSIGWVASRFLGTAQYPEPKEQEERRAYREILELFRTGSMRVYTPLSLVLAVLVAFPLFEQWEAFLLYVFGPSKGVTDPVYSKDISYYLFSFPIYTLLQRRILIAFMGLLAGILLLYWIERRLLQQQDQRMPAGARLHVNILIAMVFLIEIWKFILQRYELLYTGFHEPLFSGPGFAEMNVVLPLIWLCMLSLAGLGVCLIRTINTGKGWKPLLGFATLFVIALVGRYSDFLPAVVNEYIVKPNAITRESPYIQHNIASTLAAYKLNEVEVREVAPERLRGEPYAHKTEGIFRNIPVWDGELLTDVFKHLQELRTYYDFAPVDVSHYTVRGHNQQVYLAARELRTSELPEGARNWINRHLSYTHGYGLVMVPAGQGADVPMTWFIKGIPLESDFGFQVEQPGIYHGLLNTGTPSPPTTPANSATPRETPTSSSTIRDRVGFPSTPSSKSSFSPTISKPKTSSSPSRPTKEAESCSDAMSVSASTSSPPTSCWTRTPTSW